MTQEVDHLYLDRASCRTLLSWLRDFSWLVPELEVVTTRRSRYGTRPERKSADTPVVFNPAASELAFEIRDVLWSWVVFVCQARRLPVPAREARGAVHSSRWLLLHVMDVAQVESARDVYDQVRELHRRAMRMADRPEEQEFVGPCQSDVPGVECDGVYARRGADTKNCVACGVCVDVPSVMAAARERLADRLYSETELVHALRVVLRRTVPRQTVRSWISAGKLVPKAGRFELGPAIELAEKSKRRGRDSHVK